jgi:hypothetical protein
MIGSLMIGSLMIGSLSDLQGVSGFGFSIAKSPDCSIAKY